EQDANKLLVFARAMNFRNKRVDTKVQLEVLVNDRIVAIKEKALSLPARKVETLWEPGKDDIVRDMPGEQAATFELSDLDDRATVVLHARLGGLNDHLPLDDEAWLVVGVVRKARVLIVGDSNVVLEAFFDNRSTQAVATVDHLDSGVVSLKSPDHDKYRKPARNGDYDLIIFDRCAPETEENMPRANTFFIGKPPPPWKRTAGDKIANPQIKGWMSKHSVMRRLTALQDVGVLEAFKMKDLPPRTPRLIEVENNNSLLLALSRGSFTDLVMTFPIISEAGSSKQN